MSYRKPIIYTGADARRMLATIGDTADGGLEIVDELANGDAECVECMDDGMPYYYPMGNGDVCGVTGDRKTVVLWERAK